MVSSSVVPYLPRLVCSQSDLSESVSHSRVLTWITLGLDAFVCLLCTCFPPSSLLLSPLSCCLLHLEPSIPPHTGKSLPSFRIWFKHHLHKEAFHSSPARSASSKCSETLCSSSVEGVLLYPCRQRASTVVRTLSCMFLPGILMRKRGTRWGFAK